MFFCNCVLFQNGYCHQKFDSLKITCEIIDIQEINNAYLLRAKDSDGVQYTIISLKSKKEDIIDIEIGEKYELLISVIYPILEKDTILVGGNIILHELIVDGVPVSFQGDFDTGFIVTTPNLKGLYYLKSE